MRKRKRRKRKHSTTQPNSIKAKIKGETYIVTWATGMEQDAGNVVLRWPDSKQRDQAMEALGKIRQRILDETIARMFPKLQ